jgi:hypothetical protein
MRVLKPVGRTAEPTGRMDLFDFFPVVPPGDIPGSSGERSPGHQLTAGVGSVLLPAINFVAVLAAGFAHDGTIAFVVMPFVSAVVVFVLGRWLAVGVAWSLVLAMWCAVVCFIGNGCALFIAALLGFYGTF